MLAWTHSWAQPAPTQPSPAEVKRARLQKGDAAPFAGTLLSDAAVAKLISDADAKLKQAQLEAERLRRDLELERRSAAVVWQAKLDTEKLKYTACSKDADRTRELLDKASNPPWYKSPYLHFLLGSVVSGGVCAAATRIK